jgi:hypothetical protein
MIFTEIDVLTPLLAHGGGQRGGPPGPWPWGMAVGFAFFPAMIGLSVLLTMLSPHGRGRYRLARGGRGERVTLGGQSMMVLYLWGLAALALSRAELVPSIPFGLIFVGPFAVMLVDHFWRKAFGEPDPPPSGTDAVECLARLIFPLIGLSVCVGMLLLGGVLFAVGQRVGAFPLYPLGVLLIGGGTALAHTIVRRTHRTVTCFRVEEERFYLRTWWTTEREYYRDDLLFIQQEPRSQKWTLRFHDGRIFWITPTLFAAAQEERSDDRLVRELRT